MSARTVTWGLGIGTASWTDKTLLESGWYPPEVKTPQDRLAYYAEQFGVVEVDATYYSLPSERNSALWADRTPKGFTFDVKAFSLLTQHPTKTTALPKALRPEDAKARVYLKDLPAATVDEVWDRFLGALAPLHEAGKLGAILLQFPQWFPGRQEQPAVHPRMRRALQAVPGQRRVPQQDLDGSRARRARRWISCVDTGSRTSASTCRRAIRRRFRRSSRRPRTLLSCASTATARGWNSRDIYQRFGYRYSEKELEEWAPKVRDLSEQAKETHVLMNNCYRDYAQVNAAQLAALI